MDFSIIIITFTLIIHFLGWLMYTYRKLYLYIIHALANSLATTDLTRRDKLRCSYLSGAIFALELAGGSWQAKSLVGRMHIEPHFPMPLP